MDISKETVNYSIDVFRQVGFPAIVAGWLLVRIEKRLDNLTLAVMSLRPKLPPPEAP